jgi:histidinol-phosphate aminotransferase
MWAGVRARRDKLAGDLTALGLTVHASGSNFLLVDFGAASAVEVQQRLEDRRILVRHLGGSSDTENCLRITVGSADEMQKLLESLRECL